MGHHHVHKPSCTAKDAGAGILQEGLHVLAKGGRLQIHAKLIQHLFHAALVFAQYLQHEVSSGTGCIHVTAKLLHVYNSDVGHIRLPGMQSCCMLFT